MEAIVDVQDLGRRYGRRWALRGVDLAVRAGEMVGVVGADGAGKTTLLQICAAILDPSQGRCRVLGFDSVDEAKQITSRIGYMSQGFTLYDRLSVAENLRFSAQVRGVGEDDYGPRRDGLLAMAGIGAFLDRPAGQLSGGMRKKLSLCTNLIHEPELLILDEPGLGVDPLSRRELWSMLDTFRHRGITILVATSYMDEAERCDRVLLLRGGEALAADRPAAVRSAAAGRVFELVTSNPMQAALELDGRPELLGVQILPDRVRFQRSPSSEAALDNGLVAGSAHEVEPTLEDVFVLHAASSRRAARSVAMPRGPERAGDVRAEHVTVRFGRFVAVDDVSLDAEAGTMLALVGPNGAGKTTLIRAFCGLAPIAGGAAWIGGERVAAGVPEQRRHVGYMSQRFSLYRDLSLGENLAFFAAAYGLGRVAAAEAAAWARAVTELEAEEDDLPVASMSGATRQRLALACSILHRPSVLFLDEPTSGVDPVSRYRFWWLIRSLARSGMVVFVTTHYLDEAAYCDRIGLMHHGRLIALGSLAELREQEDVDAGAPVEAVFIHAIRRTGLDVR